MTQVERIREVCKSKKIAVKKLEQELGYGNGFLNPKKIKVISSDRLFEIAKYLDVSAAYLAGEEDGEPAPRSELTDGDIQLLSLYRQLNEQGREKLIDYANDLVYSGRYKKTDKRGVVSEAS